MKFSTREDIEAPIDQVFAALTDFTRFEREAMRRGAVVSRKDELREPGPGMCWEATVKYRGRKRKITAEMTKLDPGKGYEMLSRIGGVETNFTVGLVGLSRRKTRLAVAADLKPKTLAARVFLQSLKLAKGSLDKRFKRRVGDFARMVARDSRAA